MRRPHPNRDSDLDRELRSHLQAVEEDLRAQGYSPGEASSAANRALGNLDRIKEDVRETWGGHLFRNTLQDTRYSVRNLLRARYFGRLIEKAGDFESLVPVAFSIFCFRFRPQSYMGDLDALN
jgi:hypothetical protein